ncbi:MAG TPA: energy-coupling factor transporter ATPase, partial [Oscillospiraceae bacterium]|nr:energy-coupling factor transporter ATPase [Oscillospiraceae bacterium]
MESFSIKNLSFSYPGQKGLILDNINLTVSKGEFLVLCGPSGCGKTTLLRQLKTVLAPYGIKSGEIYFEGTLLEDLNHRQQSENIGFVSQNPDNQIVTDKVWHELAFGLESLGYDTPAIRLRVAEMASFFGIENWFHKDVSELSGGQKQLLSLASIMAMQPSVLILDEPASQLDPIVASEFIEIIGKINREIGTTIILTEHRLEDTMALADRVLVMDKGKIIADGTPKEVGQAMSRKNHKMFLAMPVPMRIYASVENQLSCPVTVREGREWLDEFSKFNPLKVIEENNEIIANENKVALELDEVWFRYKKELPDVVKGASIKVSEGEFLSILGGNGTGKSTVLSLISGINKPYRGKIRIYGDELHNISDEEKFNGLLGILPQNSRTLFAKKTVKLDLYEIFKGQKLSEEEKQNRLKKVANICDIAELMGRHPYDLSEGERQRAALAKVLLLRPEILLLDEPTRGMDAEFKQKFAVILKKLLEKKVTIIMVSHDIEFCAKYTERAALFFDGGIVTEGRTGEFFSGNSFYTTAANRLSRHILPGAIVADDIIKACGGKILPDIDIDPDEHENGLYDEEDIKIPDLKEEKQSDLQVEKDKGHLSKRTATAAILILLLIPLTIYFG